MKDYKAEIEDIWHDLKKEWVMNRINIRWDRFVFNKLIEARQEIDKLKEGVKDALKTFKSIGCTTEAEIVQALLKLIKE